MFRRDHFLSFLQTVVRIYFQVPFAHKNDAKRMGMKWNSCMKLWYYEYDSNDDDHMSDLCPDMFRYDIISVYNNKELDNNILEIFIKKQIPIRRQVILKDFLRKKHDKYLDMYGPVIDY